MVSLLAGTTNIPIASSIMFIELFGRNNAYYAAFSCIITFIINGYRNVYPFQIIQIKKHELAEGHKLLRRIIKKKF